MFYFRIRPASPQADGDFPTVLHKFRDLSPLGPILAIRAKLQAARASKAAGADPAAGASGRGSSTRTLAVLTRCVGTLRPATATLLLAPPGHGKSSLLRALAGHIPAHELTGTLTYSGVPAAQLASRKIKLSLLAAYVDQANQKSLHINIYIFHPPSVPSRPRHMLRQAAINPKP